MSRRPGSWRSVNLPLDHHLGRDAGMIGARLPQHVRAAHALEAAQHVLQGIVQRMAHMQRAGDVGRRNDDRVRLGVGALGPAGLEGAGLFPGLVNAAFDFGRLIGLIDHSLGFFGSLFRVIDRLGVVLRGLVR